MAKTFLFILMFTLMFTFIAIPMFITRPHCQEDG
jgi:hypothetical protein